MMAPRGNEPLARTDRWGVAALIALLAAAELTWRVAAHRWAQVIRIGDELVARLHPDVREASDLEAIGSNYVHALWLLAALVLACALLWLVRAMLKRDLWVPSPWVPLLPLFIVVAASLSFLLAEPGPTPEQRSLRAEEEQASGTGAVSYDRVIALMAHCHDALRKRLAGKAEVDIDNGLDPAVSFIYAYRMPGIPGQRFVRMAASEKEVLSGSLGRSAGALMPPIEGGFQVQGLVIYSGDEPAVSYRDLREYTCAMRVSGERYDVRDLTIQPVR
jgi:hypothetical protein